MKNEILLSYIDVCTLAFQNNWTLDIRPNDKKIICLLNNQTIAEFIEIGNCFFVKLN